MHPVRRGQRRGALVTELNNMTMREGTDPDIFTCDT